MPFYYLIVLKVTFLVIFWANITLAQTSPPIELRYNVHVGDQFKTSLKMAGTISSKTFNNERTVEEEKNMEYKIDFIQSVESVAEDGTLVISIKPIPGTITMSVDGLIKEVHPDILPDVSLGISRSGEIRKIEYVNRSMRTQIDEGFFDFIRINSGFPNFPDREIMTGERWRLLPYSTETEYAGEAKLLEIVRLEGSDAGKLLIHASMPIKISKDVQRDYAAEGLRADGKISTEMTQLFELNKGWPFRGEGKVMINLNLTKDGEGFYQTLYDLHTNFTTTYE